MKWLFCVLIVLSIHLAAANNKLLVLVIANDTPPVYVELQKLWRSYMHLDREHVEVYFLKATSALEKPFEFQDDVLWIKTDENLVPGILNKTILSFKALLPRIQNEFDYVLRTNLSSFYVFPRLLQFLQTLPTRGCYSALIGECDGLPFGAEAGFILSPDLVELVVEREGEFLNHTWHYDDVVIGKFFRDLKIGIIPAPRMDFYSLNAWKRRQGVYLAAAPYYPPHVVRRQIPEDVFHFRIKQGDPKRRLAEDIPIYKALVEQFYTAPLRGTIPK